MLVRAKCFVVLLILICGWNAQVGCTPAPGKLDLQMYYIPDERGQQTFNSIKKYRIILSGSGITKTGQSFEMKPDESNAVLPNVECDKEAKGNVQVQVDVIGYADENSEQASHSGRQISFIPCGRPRVFTLFISPVDSFSPLTEFVGSPDEISRFGQSEERLAGHAVISLPDGRVLFTGGANLTGAGKIESVSNNVTIFDPETGIFSNGLKMSTPRAFHSASLVNTSSGVKVVLVGGIRAAGLDVLESVKGVDILQVNTDGTIELVAGPQLEEGRAFHTATVTPQKNLLIYGGFQFQPGSDPKEAIKSAGSWEILAFDAGSLSNRKQGALTGEMPRGMHTATLLPDNNKILLVGGMKADSSGPQALDTVLEAELNADETGLTVQLSGDKLKHKRAGHTATFLDNNQFLLIVGGMEPDGSIFVPKTIHKSMDLFTSVGKMKTPFASSLNAARVFHSSNRLQDGRVLVFGGLTAANAMAAKAEIFTPNSDTILQETPLLVGNLKDRFFHSGTVMLNGSLLIFGGATLQSSGTPYATLNKGELFNPGPPRPSL